jgi:hypothetical protein
MSLAPARPSSSSSGAASVRTGKFRKFTKALGQTPDAISGAPTEGGRVGNVPADRVSISELARQRSKADDIDARPHGGGAEGDDTGLESQHAAAAALLVKRQIAANGFAAVTAHSGSSPWAAIRLLT